MSGENEEDFMEEATGEEEVRLKSIVNVVKQQVDHTIEDGRSKRSSNQGPSNDRGEKLDHNDQALQENKMERIKAFYGRGSKPYAATSSGGQREETGQQMDFAMLNYLESLSCMDPRIYKGERSEKFKEFIRRFKRKCGRVVTTDKALEEILGDDHLGGRAKSVYISLPEDIKRKGFEEVVEEMGRLLSEDSAAGRMQAIAELRDLKFLPNQDVTEFCVALEKLGRKANPDGKLEERSLEFAEILLANLKHWPEHVQLLSALHRVKPEKAYDEVKQLALSIELAKKLYGSMETQKVDRRTEWKQRMSFYKRGSIAIEPTEISDNRNGMQLRGFDRKEQSERQSKGIIGVVPMPRGTGTRRQDVRAGERMGSNETRKCFNCSKYAHIAKDCPQKKIHVRELRDEPREQEMPRNIMNALDKACSLG
ncbi:zinc knuckle, partial [Oesophagostomum dentatum]